MDFGEIETSYILFLPEIFPTDCQDDLSGDLFLNQNQYVSQDTPFEEIEEPTPESSEDESDSSESVTKDQVEEMDITELYNKTQVTDARPAVYDTLPPYFADLESWPKTCNIECWVCGNTPESMPWTIFISKTKILVPVDVDSHEIFIYNTDVDIDNDKLLLDCREYKEIKVYEYRGVFCHAFCARRYIKRVRDNKITNEWEAVQFLIGLYNLVNGTDLEDIPESDDPYTQKKFTGGAGIDSAEYMARNKLKESKYL